MLKCKTGCRHTILVLFFGLFLPVHYAGADERNPEKDDYFAIVNNKKISATEYIYHFRKSAREKFFHGKASEKELDAFRKSVAEQLVLDVLLDQEANKRGLQPDAKKVDQALDELDVKNSSAESEEERRYWEENRDKILPIVKVSIEREALVEQLREQVKKIDSPSVQAVKKYYENNKDKFTEPQQWDVSIILLAVDPSSSPDLWEETVEKAEKLLKKLNKGESFEELARIHSGDESAVNGGHMGYMHIGMFGEPAQKVLNVMEPGDISEPVVLLEGVALLRLNEVKEAGLNTFEDVQERASNLLKREMAEQAWEDLQTTLRQSAQIKYNDLFLKELNLNLAADNAS